MLRLILPFFLIATLSFSALADVSSSQPSMFTDCPEARTLKAPGNSAGVYYSADCRIAYVLPPREGKIWFAEPTQTANVKVCGSVQTALESVDARSRKIRSLIKQIDGIEKQIGFDGLKDPWLSAEPNQPPQGNINPELEELERLRDQATADVLKVLKFNEEVATYEGPKVRLTVSADQDALVREYQRLNPKQTFRPMPLARSVLTLVGRVDKNIGRAPAALYMDMSGVRVPASYFTGLKPEDLDKKNGGAGEPVLFTSAVSGQLVMSLIGACPFYDYRSGTFPETIDQAKLTSNIAPTVDYFYNVAVNRAYYARYNMAELLKRIQKQSTKGGFFSSSTLNSLVVEQNSSGWFEFRSLAEDTRNQWNDDLAQSIKAQLIDRLLKRLGARPVGPAEMPGIIAPGKTGAEATSTALKQCPHIYCQAGAYILDALSATVGGSSAVSEYINSQNHWEEETVRETRMVPQLGQVGF